MKSSWPPRLPAFFFLATTIGIVLYTMYAAFHYSSNAILGRDEANFIILSSQKILAANGLRELTEAFFPSHGQHTLLGMQLVNMFTYHVFDVLDRRIMNVIGVVILCAAALLLQIRRTKNRVETILVCATLLPVIFSPSHNACIVNASCTGNHYFGIATSVVSLYFFTKITTKKYCFIFAELFMLLAIFSLPASLALIPISFLVLSTSDEKNKFSLMGVHLAFIALVLAFHSYLTYPNTIFAFTQDTGHIPLSEMITNTAMFVITFFIILGSLFYWLADLGYTWILVVIGAIISVFMTHTIVKICKSSDNGPHSFHFYGTLLFLVMILIICFGRYYSLGSSRYSVYTAFLCAMLFMTIFSRVNQSDAVVYSARRIKILFCSASLSLLYFFVALHYHQQYLLDLEQKDVLCRKLWYTEGYACGVMISHEEATQIIKSAINQGIYRVEQ
jgi:hypothetical protein